MYSGSSHKEENNELGVGLRILKGMWYSGSSYFDQNTRGPLKGRWLIWIKEGWVQPHRML